MAEPEEQEQASEERDELPAVEDLPALSEDELYQLACTLKIPRRSKMSQVELLSACTDALRQRAANGPSEVEPGEDKSEDPELTQADYRRIVSASTDSLEVVLADPKLTPTRRRAIERELGERNKVKAAEALKAEVPEQHYRVTKGGRYVAHGVVGHLAEGSVLTRLTHDLKDVARQGIVFEKCDPPSVVHGMLGEQITRFQ